MKIKYDMVINSWRSKLSPMPLDETSSKNLPTEIHGEIMVSDTDIETIFENAILDISNKYPIYSVQNACLNGYTVVN